MFQSLINFDDPLHTLSRKSDPASSARAVSALAASGQLASQTRQVLDALAAHGPCSSKELSARSGIDRYVCARRLADCLRKGLVTRQEPEHGDVIWKAS